MLAMALTRQNLALKVSWIKLNLLVLVALLLPPPLRPLLQLALMALHQRAPRRLTLHLTSRMALTIISTVRPQTALQQSRTVLQKPLQKRMRNRRPAFRVKSEPPMEVEPTYSNPDFPPVEPFYVQKYP